MKSFRVILAFICLLAAGCSKDEINPSLQGFNIVVNDKVIVSHNDIDIYDFSTHLIYLKKECTYFDDYPQTDTFSVYANGGKMYSGVIPTKYSCSILPGPQINGSMCQNRIIHIGFIQFLNQDGSLMNNDPRGNPLIGSALTDFGQYHAGLACKINSITFTSPTNVTFEFEIKNNDSFNFYIFDPVKMGIQQFHYFTNGLFLYDLINHQGYHANVVSTQPDPWDSWKKEWLSLIKSKETKKFSINYPNFDSVPTGKYKASFNFPGLTNGLHNEDLQQSNGRLWIGNLMPEIEITVK